MKRPYLSNKVNINLAPFMGLLIALIAVLPLFLYSDKIPADFKTYSALCVLYLLWACFRKSMIYMGKWKRKS